MHFKLSKVILFLIGHHVIMKFLQYNIYFSRKSSLVAKTIRIQEIQKDYPELTLNDVTKIVNKLYV